MNLTQRDAEKLAAALCETDPEPNEAMRRAAMVHDECRREVMDRIGEGKVAIKEAAAALAACEGAPATIQPGAVVQMAEALEEYAVCQRLQDSGRVPDWDSACKQAIAALIAYYGEEP